jgi:hypothetical protein
MLHEKSLHGAHLFRSDEQFCSIFTANLALFGHLHPDASPAAIMSENR